ncbi:hypothetical protein AgCh_006927 [Apium graveolens]
MASKRPPTSNTTKPNLEDEQGCVLVVNRTRRHSIGGSNMVGPANGIRNNNNRQVFCVVNGAAAAAAAAQEDLAASDYGGEFTKQEVDALLNEKMKTKNKFNLKEKCDQMMEYIKKLRRCIRSFQQLEGNFLFEQDNFKKLLELGDKKCNDMELLMNSKEEEFNSIIIELRKNCTSLQEKVFQEESDKLAALETLNKEKMERASAERLQSSLSEELARAQRENSSVTQKIISLTEMYKRLQEYNTSLQDFNSKLQKELSTTNETLERVEKEKSVVVEKLSNLRSQYNNLQDQLTSSIASQDETMKQNEALINEIECLRGDLQKTRNDRDQQQSQLEAVNIEHVRYKECAEKSFTELEKLTLKSNELEAKCSSQTDQLRKLEDHLAVAEKKLQMSDMSALEIRMGFEDQKTIISELQSRLDTAEIKIVDGEKLRKKLHNTILELKGNIRVFCRVRPLLIEDGIITEENIITYPTTTEAFGRGIDLIQHGQKHSFTFDKVFAPEASQDEVFVEISQLVQSALDGYKVCIFAYGQTGSGKTYTMMGKSGSSSDKEGLIPRSLRQIFETKQSLEQQGWKYDMQVSMLEIYNETIRDLLSTNRSSIDMSKQYIIKHDTSGNTHVSDLTIIDVRSSGEVSFFLDRAAQSRSVGKTQMNEQSSRSHFVFTLRITGVNESTAQQVQGVLNLVDLAGSERLSRSGSTGDRLKETQAINKSLSSLSDVIFSLAKKEEHIPFRNSKLTYLLQTLMVVNVSPDQSSVAESLCSLRFAARVNACEIGIPRRQTNMRVSDHHRLSYG